MPGIGSSLGGAAKAGGETIVKPTVDTLKASVTEGIVEPILGTNPKPAPTDPAQNKPQTSATSQYNPKQRQNVVNFLNAAAAQEKQSKAHQDAQANAIMQQEQEQKKQTEIKQIEVKKAKRSQMLSRAVYDKQRGVEIKKGSI